MQVHNVRRLDAGQLSAVLVLSAEAMAVDEVAPLSEQVLLAARDGRNAGPSAGSTNRWPHFLGYSGTHLAGYAHLDRGSDGHVATAEVVVDPADRRHGVGTALVRALEH